MNEQAISEKIRQILRKSRGEPSKFIELIECINSMNNEGEAASYPRLVRRMWPQEWERAENRTEFELTKWDLLCKRRREINRRVFSSPMCFEFFIALSPDKQFKILTDPKEIHTKRQKELEWNLAREKSESNKETIRAQIIELKGKSHDWGIEEAGGIAETPGDKEPDLLATEKTRGEVRKETKRRLVIALAVTLVILAVGSTLTFISFSHKSTARLPSVQTSALALTGKPSIAVLPFLNMGGDPKEEFFSDGLMEDIITSLSKMPNLLVIARNSTYVYKGKAANVQKVAEDLGVRYVLEGSVQGSGDKVRISARLIDALNGYHVWSERYDREMKDIFALQDKITLETLKALDVKLLRGEAARIQGKGTDNLAAYTKLLQGREIFAQQTRESNVQARQLFEEAIRLDPNYAIAYFFLALVTETDAKHGISKSRKDSLTKAIELDQKAISLDDACASAHGHLGQLYALMGEYEESIEECQRAIEIAPNLDDAYVFLALVLNLIGRSEEAIPVIEKGFRLNPLHPNFAQYNVAARAYYLVGRYEDAVRMNKELLSHWPNNFFGQRGLVLSYSAMGSWDEAHAAAMNLVRIHPDFSVQQWGRSVMTKNRAVIERDMELMRKAGLPD
jgi:TolB-like protein